MFHRKEIQHTKTTQVSTRILKFPRQKNNPESDHKNQNHNHHRIQTEISQYQSNDNVSHSFAYQLLCSEMELQTSEEVSIDLVTRLFELYKRGIQFYNLRHDKRQQFFKKKLQSFNLHPSVLKTLQKGSDKVDGFYKQKQLQRLIEISNKNTNMNATKMLKILEEADKKNVEKIQMNISSQQEQIKKRIQARKNASKPATSTKDQNQFIDDDDLTIQLPKVKSKKKAIQSFGVSQFRNNKQQDYDNYFVEKFVDI